MEALTNFTRFMWTRKIWRDSRGQDLVEYALLTAFLAMAAGAMMGTVAENINPMFSKIASVMSDAADTAQQMGRPAVNARSSQ